MTLKKFNVHFSYPPCSSTAEAEFDAIFSDFASEILEKISIKNIRFSVESNFLRVLGMITGDSLKVLQLEMSTEIELSNVDCWRNFIQQCRFLTDLEIFDGKMTRKCFAELGRSRSLRRISYRIRHVGYGSFLLTAGHMRHNSERSH